jgi:hypothetical protein
MALAQDATERVAMRVNRALAIASIAASIIFPACSASRLRQKVGDANAEIQLANQAWQAARIRLHSMCPHAPKTMDEVTQSLKLDQENGCYARLAKDTHAPTLDDWHWRWLPPYQVVIAVYDEELRKRVIPRLYEEYMLGLTRYLAEKADNDEITPEQLRHAFTASWNWLRGKIQDEPILLKHNVRSAENADAATRDRVTTVAGSLATVATLALIVSAEDRAFQPAPANCYAYPTAERNYKVDCY